MDHFLQEHSAISSLTAEYFLMFLNKNFPPSTHQILEQLKFGCLFKSETSDGNVNNMS